MESFEKVSIKFYPRDMELRQQNRSLLCLSLYSKRKSVLQKVYVIEIKLENKTHTYAVLIFS